MKYEGSGKGAVAMGCWSRCRSEVKGERGKTRPARGRSNPGTEEKSSEVRELQSRVSVEISVLVGRDGCCVECLMFWGVIDLSFALLWLKLSCVS